MIFVTPLLTLRTESIWMDFRRLRFGIFNLTWFVIELILKKYAQLEYKPQRLSYLRALAINSLIQDAVKIFIENEAAILEGTFDAALLDKKVNTKHR